MNHQTRHRWKMPHRCVICHTFMPRCSVTALPDCPCRRACWFMAGAWTCADPLHCWLLHNHSSMQPVVPRNDGLPCYDIPAGCCICSALHPPGWPQWHTVCSKQHVHTGGCSGSAFGWCWAVLSVMAIVQALLAAVAVLQTQKPSWGRCSGSHIPSFQ